MIICAIYDKKAKTYDTPFALPNAAVAQRAFAQQMTQPQMKNFCKDFELHQLGDFKNNETRFEEQTKSFKISSPWKLEEKPSVICDGAIFNDELPVQETTQK